MQRKTNFKTKEALASQDQYESDNESYMPMHKNNNISKINELLHFILNTLHSKKSKEKVLQNICNDYYYSINSS